MNTPSDKPDPEMQTTEEVDEVKRVQNPGKSSNRHIGKADEEEVVVAVTSCPSFAASVMLVIVVVLAAPRLSVFLLEVALRIRKVDAAGTPGEVKNRPNKRSAQAVTEKIDLDGEDEECESLSTVMMKNTSHRTQRKKKITK